MNEWEQALNRVMESTDAVRDSAQNFNLVRASRLQMTQEVWETPSSVLTERYGSTEAFEVEWLARIQRVAAQ